MVAAGCSGGDWEAIEERWSMYEYNEMQRHWRLNGPPVYMSVAGYLGLIKEDRKASTEYGSLDELEALFGSTGGEITMQ